MGAVSIAISAQSLSRSYARSDWLLYKVLLSWRHEGLAGRRCQIFTEIGCMKGGREPIFTKRTGNKRDFWLPFLKNGIPRFHSWEWPGW